MKKILVLLLSLSLTVSALVACNNNIEPNKESIPDIVYDSEKPLFTLIRDEFTLKSLEDVKPMVGLFNVFDPYAEKELTDVIRIDSNVDIELIEVFDKDENLLYEKGNFECNVPINVFLEPTNIIQITLDDYSQLTYEFDYTKAIIKTNSIYVLKDAKIQKDATVYASSPFKTSYSIEYVGTNFSRENIKHYDFYVDESAYEIVRLIADDQIKLAEVYSIDEHGNRLELLASAENLEAYTEINFIASYSETIPNLEISLTLKDGANHSYIPVYNGIDGGYDFAQ